MPDGLEPVTGLLRIFADASAMRERGLFAAEGRFVVERVLRSGGFEPLLVAVTPPARVEMAADLARVPEATIVELPPRELQALVGYPLDRGCVAVVRRPPPRGLGDIVAHDRGRCGTWLVLEDVSNPDNVGSLFRSAAAFGAAGIVLVGGCADPLYRKSVRTSLGNTLSVPFANAAGADDVLRVFEAEAVANLALVARDGTPLHECRRHQGRVALWLGHEGRGLSPCAIAGCGERATIVMPGGIDSLNVAVAGAVALHHLVTSSVTRRP